MSYETGALKKGYDSYTATEHAERPRVAGFVNVQQLSFSWPVSTWRCTEQKKQLGDVTLQDFSKNIALVGVLAITHESIMLMEEAKVLVSQVQHDVANDLDSKRYYMSMWSLPLSLHH